ncbi:hypothetical protein ACV56Z_11810 [Staphylococcus aureus]
MLNAQQFLNQFSLEAPLDKVVFIQLLAIFVRKLKPLEIRL